MSELIFLSIAAMAAAFKLLAIVIGMVWAFRHLMTAHSAPLNYRHTDVKIPFRPWRASN